MIDQQSDMSHTAFDAKADTQLHREQVSFAKAHQAPFQIAKTQQVHDTGQVLIGGPVSSV